MNSLRLKAVAVLVAVFALFFAPTAANAYTPTAPAPGEQTIEPGGTTTIVFTGFEPGETVVVTLTGPDAGNGELNGQPGPSITMIADENGNVTVTVTLPPGSSDGDEFVVTAVGENSGEASFALNVSDNSGSGDDDDDDDNGAGAGDGGSNLPKVGSAASMTVLGVGGAMLLIGAGIVFVARRQQDN